MKKVLISLLFSGSLLLPLNTLAASCCGGGSASSLILPKMADSMFDYSFSYEKYDGFWNVDGDHIDDPEGSSFEQYRSNFAYANRLGYRWQASIQVPYVWNKNIYPEKESATNGLGDTVLGLWYESFDDVKCVWKVTGWKSLEPAIYFGTSLTLPTGKSMYSGDVTQDNDVTGRGSYRLDANLLIDKTIYPWSLSWALSYGMHIERPVNEEFGRTVEPYDLQLGDRISNGITFGYTHFLESLSTVTVSASVNDLREGEGKINGLKDASLPSIKKQSVGLSLSYSTPIMDWVYKVSLNHALQGDGRGENFPTTDIVNLGVTYVIR